MTGSLTPTVSSPGKIGRTSASASPSRVSRFEEPDPPVLAVRRRAADVEAPAVLEADERRPFDHRCAPALLVEHDDGLEALALVRARDHVRVGRPVSPAQPVGEHDRAVLVVGRARRASPVLWAWSGCGNDNRTGAGRQRESAHAGIQRRDFVFLKHKALFGTGERLRSEGRRGLCFRNTKSSVAGDEELPVAVRGDRGAPAEVAAAGLHRIDLLLRVEAGADEGLPVFFGRVLVVGRGPGVGAGLVACVRAA